MPAHQVILLKEGVVFLVWYILRFVVCLELGAWGLSSGLGTGLGLTLVLGMWTLDLGIQEHVDFQ